MKKTPKPNRCDHCGQFKKLSELRSYGADNGSEAVTGFECIDCAPPNLETLDASIFVQSFKRIRYDARRKAFVSTVVLVHKKPFTIKTRLRIDTER